MPTVQTTTVPRYSITNAAKYWKSLLNAHRDQKLLGQLQPGQRRDVTIPGLKKPAIFSFQLMHVGSMLDFSQEDIIPRSVISCNLRLSKEDTNDLGLDGVEGFNGNMNILQDPDIAEGRFFYETPLGLCIAKQSFRGYVGEVFRRDVPDDDLRYEDVFSKGRKLDNRNMATNGKILRLFEACSNCYHFILHQSGIEGMTCVLP